MISEASCDTEVCSNVWMKSQLWHQSNKLYFKIYNIQIENIFSCIFEHINAALLSIKAFFEKQKQPQTFEQ